MTMKDIRKQERNPISAEARETQAEEPEIEDTGTKEEVEAAALEVSAETAISVKTEESAKIEDSAVEEPKTPTETPVSPYTMYSQTSLNVRSAPDVSASKQFVLSVNDTVTVTAEVENGWVAVTGDKGRWNSMRMSRWSVPSWKTRAGRKPHRHSITGTRSWLHCLPDSSQWPTRMPLPPGRYPAEPGAACEKPKDGDGSAISSGLCRM